MMIIGCDLPTRYQQVAMLDTETGEEVERRLEHGMGEAGQALLRHLNCIVQVHRARGLHSVFLIQNDFLVHREMARRESWQ